MTEKARFAERLKAALEAEGHPTNPGYVFKQFNTHWRGRGISFQAARDWLAGTSIPRQDKLQVLADWLRIPPQVLRYGPSAATGVKERSDPWAGGASAQDRASMQAFLTLPPADRKLIGDLIKTLSAARTAADPPQRAPNQATRES